MAVFLTIVAGLTGVLETFYYVPTAEQAASSVQTISYLVPFGGLVRNLHYWSAQLLVGVLVVHLLRVVFTGAYGPPRRFNYLLGVGLLLAAMFLDFTGYVLRWDQGIEWALVVGTNLLKSIPAAGSTVYRIIVGGSELGSATLVRFYAWHIFGLAIVFLILLVWHAFRVRRDGGIAVPPPHLRPDQTRISRSELVRREVIAALLAAAALLLLAAFRAAPIAAPITGLGPTAAEARAPWFFLWVQQLLKWGDPFLLGVAVPLLILTGLAALPYLTPLPRPDELGQWFPRTGRLAQVVVAIVALGIVVLSALALLPLA
jgi:quinol-cytochrome oxidoreductase complex cytochrome b subunit